MFNDLGVHEPRIPHDSPRRGRFSLPDSPYLNAFSALVTLALAVVLLIAALPGEERVLTYRGEQVSPTALCETVDAGGEEVLGLCSELGEWETRETGWGVVQLVFAVVLAAGAAVVLASLPRQLRERRRRRRAMLERITDEDDFQHL